MTTFLPPGYESLRSDKAYWKMSQMKDGDNKIRIVKQPICGWLDWHDKKPMRYKPDKKPLRSFDPESPLKAFWALHVWDYSRETLFVLEVTQSSILKALTQIGQDPDWGDFTKYDIKITKEGSGKDTRYSLTPLPHKPLTEPMKKAILKAPVRLEALYEGGDPWTDLVGDEDVDLSEVPEICAESSQDMTPFEQLQELLALNSIDHSRLQEYIDDIAARKKKAPSVAMEGMLLPEMRNTFKEHYQKWLKAVSQKSA